MTLQEMAENAFTVAKGIVEDGEELIPIFMVEFPDGHIQTTATPWASGQEKEIVFRAMRSAFARLKVHAYVFVTEAWVSKFSKEEDETRPSEDPNRTEAIIVQGASRTGGKAFLQADITTDKDGKRHVGEMTNMGYAEAQGTLATLLEPEAVH